MYKEKEQVPEFEDFYVPFGGHLREDNRWVRLAAIIPWEEIEAEYKKCFSKRIGRTAKTAQLVANGAFKLRAPFKIKVDIKPFFSLIEITLYYKPFVPKAEISLK